MSLKRSDRQYIEVEEFEDYELTQCIAYEMAARGEQHKNKANEVINFYKKNKEMIDLYISLRDEILQLSEVNHDKLIEANEKHREIVILIGEIEIISKDTPYEYEEPRLGNEFWEIHDKCMGVANLLSREEKAEIFHSPTTSQIIVNSLIERKDYAISTYMTAEEDNCTIPIDPENQDCEYKAVETIEDFYLYAKEEPNNVKSDITVIERFKRPKINIDELKTLDTTLTINLNRPLDEIIAFIKYIKNDMKNNNLFKSPIEVLGLELKKADNLICNQKGEKCFDPRGILSKQEKMADMFYIYDCLKLGYSQRKIQSEVYNYYADKGKDNTTLDPATLRKYRDIAIEYIDNQKYKEMVTGISIDDLI